MSGPVFGCECSLVMRYYTLASPCQAMPCTVIQRVDKSLKERGSTSLPYETSCQCIDVPLQSSMDNVSLGANLKSLQEDAYCWLGRFLLRAGTAWCLSFGNRPLIVNSANANDAKGRNERLPSSVPQVECVYHVPRRHS
jgi:hypothetical protein